MKRVTATELLAEAERRTVHGITPNLVDVVIEKDPTDDCYTVCALWSNVDRARGVGTVTRNERLARRLASAMRAGVAVTVERVMRDDNGDTYVQEHREIFARTLNADLRRLGF